MLLNLLISSTRHYIPLHHRLLQNARFFSSKIEDLSDPLPLRPRHEPFEVTPIRSKDELLKRMRSYAMTTGREVDGRLLPPSFAQDAEKVLRGDKQLLTEDDAMDFGCTQCGKCCRQLASTILLDPHDLWLMKGRHGQTSQQFHDQFNGVAFEAMLGCFPPSDVEEDPLSSQNTQEAMFSYSLPILMMKVEAGRACHFSTPLDASIAKEDADKDPSIPLACSLGRDSQPTACSLYPLGELWTSPMSSTAFYSLDLPSQCEGLKPVPERKVSTVRAYLQANKLPQRHAEWEWFQKTAKRFASHRFPLTAWQRPRTLVGPDQEVPAESSETINATLSVVHDIMFNWDALPVAPQGGFGSWEEAREMVERGLGAVTELSQVLRDSHYLVTPQHPPEAWISLYEQAFYAPLIELGYVAVSYTHLTLPTIA